MQRRLEKTLSGMLAPEPKPRPAAPPPRRRRPGPAAAARRAAPPTTSTPCSARRCPTWTWAGRRRACAPAPAPRPGRGRAAVPAPLRRPSRSRGPRRPRPRRRPPAVPADAGVRKRGAARWWATSTSRSWRSWPAHPAAPRRRPRHRRRSPPRAAGPPPLRLRAGAPSAPTARARGLRRSRRRRLPRTACRSQRARAVRLLPGGRPRRHAAHPGLRREERGQPGERFGQYVLLERIAIGGMAEVWKARMRGVEGFQKIVAIKKILPHLSDNADFVGMFIDEAKLAAQLNHPNIVHIYDLGKIEPRLLHRHGVRRRARTCRRCSTPAAASGPAARRSSSRCSSRPGSPRALDYAHRKRDFEDQELGLVHRDVSPQNVLHLLRRRHQALRLRHRQGRLQGQRTRRPGALKGKLQYMSPEQAWGTPHRPPLRHLLAGHRALRDAHRRAPVHRRQRDLRPRAGAPGPGAVAPPGGPRRCRARWTRSSSRALAVDPQARFQTAGEMKQRLEAALATLALRPAPPTSPPTSTACWSRTRSRSSPRRRSRRPPPGRSGARRDPASAVAPPLADPPAEPELPVEAPVAPVAPAGRGRWSRRRAGARAAPCSTPPSRP